jgi:hypothetical protein
VRFDAYDFRHAAEILEHRIEWQALREAIDGISRDEVLRAHTDIEARRTKSPAGAQTAINAVFRNRLLDWKTEPRLFDSADHTMRGWKMDFFKNGVGVEVSFNHAEAIPWTFTRLNIAGESQDVIPDHRIDVGIAVFASQSLKTWGMMDAAVGTYEIAREWLRHMRPILPVPILVVGLRVDDWQPGPFRGTASRANERLGGHRVNPSLASMPPR